MAESSEYTSSCHMFQRCGSPNDVCAYHLKTLDANVLQQLRKDQRVPACRGSAVDASVSRTHDSVNDQPASSSSSMVFDEDVFSWGDVCRPS